LQENDIRRAQLEAAAAALVTWIHARRRTWPDLPADYAPRSDARLNSAPPVTELAPIADAIRPPQPIAPPPPVAPVQTEVEAEAIQPPPTRRNWREMLAGVARVLALVIRAIGRVLRGLAGVLLGVARWFAATVSRRRRRSMRRARRSRRGLAYAAAAGILLLTGWLSQPYWSTITERIVPAEEQPQPAIEKPLATEGSGQLIVRSEPSGARVSVDGKPLGVTPLDINDLSLGRHTVLIEADQGSVRRTVSITADGPTLINESIYAGFLKVFAPFEVQITNGGRALRLDDQNQVMLPPGSYQLQLENAPLGYRETHRVDVSPGQTSTLSIVPPPSSLTVTANVPAVVSVDGEQVGVTPLMDHPIALGTRDIVVRSESGQEKRFTSRVTVAPFQLAVEF
jgi:CRISPR/Cas system-associated exonuclease Cas4 (RecB family)